MVANPPWNLASVGFRILTIFLASVRRSAALLQSIRTSPTALSSSQNITAAVHTTQAMPTEATTQMSQTTFLSREAKIEQWLETFGIQFNPFVLLESEEDERLEQYYVEHAAFSDNCTVHDALIYARSGGGKTATRLRLEAYFRDNFVYDHVFAFSYVIPEEKAANPRLTLDDHLQNILGSAVQTIFVLLAQFGYALPKLRDPGVTNRCAAIFDRCLPWLDWRDSLKTAVRERSLQARIRHLTYRPIEEDRPPLAQGTVNSEWINEWVQWLEHDSARAPDAAQQRNVTHEWEECRQLIIDVGAEALVVLIDGVDARIGSELQPAEHMAAVTRPFIDAIQRHALGSQVAMKLFLPMQLRQMAVATSIDAYEIHWEQEALARLLRTRLEAASNVAHMNQLADPGLPDLEALLVEQAHGSPRRLICLANSLLRVTITPFTYGEKSCRISQRALQQFIAQIEASPGLCGS